MNGSRVAEVSSENEQIIVGSVQTATLAIIVDHEIDILQHTAHHFGYCLQNLKAKTANGVVGRGLRGVVTG